MIEVLKMSCITYNEQGFVQTWDLKNVRPEPLLFENMKLKLTTKSQIETRLP